MSIISIDSLTKRFGNTVAVNDVSINIEENEIYGLLGPNGAGKSTLINIVCGLLRADRGRISILGKDLEIETDFIKRNIGLVPQDIAIYEELTAYENVSFFAGLYGLRGSKKKAMTEMALEFTGLADKAREFPSRFSGGMRRRLNIACAVAHTPRIIIMDEPTVGIDPQSRNHILQSIKRLNEIGCTIIYTSHYMEEVEELCTRIGIMDNGSLIVEGTKQSLKASIADTDQILIDVDSTLCLEEKELSEIDGVLSVKLDDRTISVKSVNNCDNLQQILATLLKYRISIHGVRREEPNLESVFLHLTGRKLRD